MNPAYVHKPAQAGPGPLIAIGGLLMLAISLLTGLDLVNTGLDEHSIYELTQHGHAHSEAQPPFALHRLIEANLADATPETPKAKYIPTQPFHGFFRGISIEGLHKAAYEMDLQRQEDRVFGKLRTPYGKKGAIEGHVSGNTLFYRWELGEKSGRGLALQESGTLRGTWGYGDSAQNGGRNLLHLEI